MQAGDVLTPGAQRSLSLTQTLQRVLRQQRSGIALVDGERQLSWGEFAQRVARLAGALQSLGLAPGERVAMLANNSHHFLEAFYASVWAGGIFTPLNFRLAAPELVAILEDAGARIVVIDEANLPLGREVLARYAASHVLYAGDGAAPAGMLSLDALIEQAAPVPDAGGCGDDVAALYYTSGSTGKPKGVMHTHTNLVCSAMAAAAAAGIDDSAVTLISGPLFHVGAAGLCIPALVAGSRVVLLARFEPGEVLRLIDEQRITLMSMVPTMLRMVVDHPSARTRDLSCFRNLMYGAAPMPELLVQEARELFANARFTHAYGMTESTASVTVLPSQYAMPSHRHLGKWKSVGRAIASVDIEIVDAQDRVLAPGHHGEVVLRGPLVMKGYWNQPELTAQTLRNGWLHTGDLGYMDEDGFVYLVDRLKDMIISGGENVYSAEVEAAIYSLPGVQQCAVIGIPHERWGEAVHAVIAAAPGAGVTPEAVIEHCRGLIAAYKCPRSVEVRSEPLPLSGANKISKPVLRAPYWEGRGSSLV